MSERESAIRQADEARDTDDAAPAAGLPTLARQTAKGRGRLDSDIEDILVAATDVRRAIDRELRSFWRKKNLTERGLYILQIVDRGFDRPSLLIDYFDVLPSTITVEIEKLVSADLLERRTVPTDRRMTQLLLTDKGAAVRCEAFELLNAKFRPRLDVASADELRACVDTLRKVVEPLEPATPRRAASEDD